MRYFPYVASFAFFLFLGLAIGGVFPFLWFFRAVGVMACAIVCLLVVEAALMKPKPAPPSRHMTAVALTLLRKGDVCIVDTVERTIERAPS